MAPAGEWISRRCETRSVCVNFITAGQRSFYSNNPPSHRPNTLFLTRRLSFFRDGSWQGRYTYYRDERCSGPVFDIVAKGKYAKAGISRRVDGATDYEFKIRRASIVPRTRAMAQQLNASPEGTCGRRGRWEKDVPQDITRTGGCEYAKSPLNTAPLKVC